MFGFSHLRTWEWQSVKPARTIVFPFVSSGIPLLLLNSLDFAFELTTHSLLVFPRVWMTLLSLANDVIIYKLAYRLFADENLANVAAILYASSYTSLVFCTRTFSNCIETILFGVLLYLVTSHCNQSSYNAKAESAKKNSARNNLNLNFFISSVTVAGFFIRVSFVVFMFVPLVYWLFKDVAKNTRLRILYIVFRKTLALIPGAFTTAIVFVICDSYYFNYDAQFDVPELVQKQKSSLPYDWIQKVSLTPLNLLRYNANASNLEKHGIHPWFLHVAVNVPLMFTPLVYIIIPAMIQSDVYCQGTNYNKHILHVLAGSLLFSLAGLSSFSHQEPRYILPLIIPITILMAKYFYPLFSRKLLLMLWILFNVVYFIFFALLHQGGVVPSMEFVHSLSKAHHGSNVEVIYYKTYMPPMHLAAVSEQSSNKFKVRDLAGSAHEVLETTLKSLFNGSNPDVYLGFPNSIPCSQIKRLQRKYQLEEQYSVFPHLSMENPPWDEDVCQFDSEKDQSIVFYLASRMTLTFYKIKPLAI